MKYPKNKKWNAPKTENDFVVCDINIIFACDYEE